MDSNPGNTGTGLFPHFQSQYSRKVTGSGMNVCLLPGPAQGEQGALKDHAAGPGAKVIS